MRPELTYFSRKEGVGKAQNATLAMLVAEARYLGNFLAVMAAIVVPIVGSVAIAQAAHLSYWAAAALFIAMVCGELYAAVWLWLRSLRNRSETTPTEPIATPARFRPYIIPLAVFIFQAYWIATAWRAYESSHSKQGADLFGLACIMTAWSTFSSVRGWRATVADRSGTTRSPLDPTRLEQFTAALEQPTRASRNGALCPLRIRGVIRLGLIALEVALMLLLVPKIGISLALVSSFSVVAGIFLIGYKSFDL